MAKGDITKKSEIDRIEIVNKWFIQVRRADIVYEEQDDNFKKEISRNFHRHVLEPYSSARSDDGNWKHNEYDLSKEDAKVKAIAEIAWDDATKAEAKLYNESLAPPL